MTAATAPPDRMAPTPGQPWWSRPPRSRLAWRQRCGEVELHRACRLDQPCVEGRQGWPSLQLHRSGDRGRRQRPGRVGYGKAKEVPAAIQKGVEEARKGFFRVPLIGKTITHPVQGEAAAGVVLLRPASPGTGVIAGGAVRAVLECAGIQDILSKSLGSDNAINVVHATVAALKGLQRPEEVAARRGLPIEDVAPAGMLRARAQAAGSVN